MQENSKLEQQFDLKTTWNKPIKLTYLNTVTAQTLTYLADTGKSMKLHPELGDT